MNAASNTGVGQPGQPVVPVVPAVGADKPASVATTTDVKTPAAAPAAGQATPLVR